MPQKQTRLHKTSEGVQWYLAVKRFSPLNCEVGSPWIGHVCPVHPTSASLDFGGHLEFLFLKLFQNSFAVWQVFCWKRSCCEYCFHKGMYLVCNNVYICGRCQNNIQLMTDCKDSMNIVQIITVPIMHPGAVSSLCFWHIQYTPSRTHDFSDQATFQCPL